MVHNYYLEEAKKKAQLQKEKPSVQQSARLPNTANVNKPKPRNFNQQPRNWPPSMSSRVLNRTCIYSANHDECILKYLSKVHSRASTQKKDAHSHKITKRYTPVEKKCDSKKHDRQIPIGQKFSPNKSSVVYTKTMPPRSGLTWKPTGIIFTQVGLKWIPIKKSVETRYNTNDSASPLGIETHNPKTVICVNSSSLSASTSMASEPISSKGSSNVNILSTSSFSQAVNKSPTHYPYDLARTFRVILFSIHSDEWKSFQSQPQTALRYGYIKNHMKTVKNGQARTRERKSAQKPEAKPKKSQPSVKQSKERTEFAISSKINKRIQLKKKKGAKGVALFTHRPHLSPRVNQGASLNQGSKRTIQELVNKMAGIDQSNQRISLAHSQA
ncbi:hypothetical protein Tco_0242456 [Tanacetum coccineum]